MATRLVTSGGACFNLWATTPSYTQGLQYLRPSAEFPLLFFCCRLPRGLDPDRKPASRPACLREADVQIFEYFGVFTADCGFAAVFFINRFGIAVRSLTVCEPVQLFTKSQVPRSTFKMREPTRARDAARFEFTLYYYYYYCCYYYSFDFIFRHISFHSLFGSFICVVNDSGSLKLFSFSRRHYLLLFLV